MGREVEQENSDTGETNNKKPRVMLFLFIIPILLLIFSIYYIVSDWIFTIKGERHFGGFRFALFCAGVFIFFLGACIVKSSMPKDARKHSAFTK